MSNELNAALIPAGASVINAGINAFAASSLNKKTREFSREMYDRQRADALSDYAMQNEYNSPKSQMARLKNAGLNPNLVYGNGNAITSASPVRSSTAPAWNPKTPDIDLGQVGTSMFNYLSAKRAQAEIDNLKLQATVMQSEKVLKDAQAINTNTQTAESAQRTATSVFQLDQANRLKDINVQAAQANLEKTQADIQYTLNQDQRAAIMNASSVREAAIRVKQMELNMTKVPSEIQEIQARIKAIEGDTRLKKLDEDLKRMGIQPHDSMFTRTVMGVLQENKKTVTEKVKSFYRKAFDFKTYNPFRTSSPQN